MSDGSAYPRVYRRSAAGRPDRAAEVEAKRSNAAIPAAVALAAVGLYLGQYTVFAPGLLGLVLAGVGLSFLSTRLNPLSPHFYLPKKPSWLAVGAVFLGALVLLADAYVLLARDLRALGLPV